MANVNVTPNFAHVFQNPVFLFAGCAIPAPGAEIPVALNAAGIPTPTIEGSPNAFWLGTTKGEAKFAAGFESDPFEVDQFEGIIDDRIIRTNSSFEGEMFEMLNLERLQKILPNTVYTKTTGPSGVEKITGGGLVTVPKTSLVGLSLDPDDEDLIVCVHIYAAVNTAGLAFSMGRLVRASVPFKFEGRDITSRPRGDRHYTFWRQAPTA